LSPPPEPLRQPSPAPLTLRRALPRARLLSDFRIRVSRRCPRRAAIQFVRVCHGPWVPAIDRPQPRDRTRRAMATYALRGCSRALLAGSNPAPASGSPVAAGGDCWLL